MDRVEGYYQKALEFRLRHYRVKHNRLSPFDITDLNNDHNLIEIKVVTDLRGAIGQIFTYKQRLLQLGYKEKLQKVIVLFGSEKYKKRYEARSGSYDRTKYDLLQEQDIHLIYAGDPIDYLDDYENAMLEKEQVEENEKNRKRIRHTHADNEKQNQEDNKEDNKEDNDDEEYEEDNNEEDNDEEADIGFLTSVFGALNPFSGIF